MGGGWPQTSRGILRRQRAFLDLRECRLDGGCKLGVILAQEDVQRPPAQDRDHQVDGERDEGDTCPATSDPCQLELHFAPLLAACAWGPERDIATAELSRLYSQRFGVSARFEMKRILPAGGPSKPWNQRLEVGFSHRDSGRHPPGSSLALRSAPVPLRNSRTRHRRTMVVVSRRISEPGTASRGSSP